MRPKIVGVIFSREDLRRAMRMRQPPDLFELRLDALVNALEEVTESIGNLKAPLVITARDSSEGGINQLPQRKRAELLLRFLPLARYVDIELSAAGKMGAVLTEARRRKVGIIISFHDLKETPRARRLREIARMARSFQPHFLKVATRTDSAPQLNRLLDFSRQPLAGTKVVAMGIGKLGGKSRRIFAKAGSPLNYAAIGSASVEGQLTVRELRRVLK